MAGLIPPLNYGMVEVDLHRSGLPNELNLRFLEQLQLKTVVYLGGDDLLDVSFTRFLEDHNVNLVHLGTSESVRALYAPIGEETVLEALRIILDRAHHPMLVCDHQGSHRTGVVIGALRKSLRWSLTSIWDEYRRYAGSKVRPANEQFIELFDTDLVDVPPNPPDWFKP